MALFIEASEEELHVETANLLKLQILICKLSGGIFTLQYSIGLPICETDIGKVLLGKCAMSRS